MARELCLDTVAATVANVCDAQPATVSWPVTDLQRRVGGFCESSSHAEIHDYGWKIIGRKLHLHLPEVGTLHPEGFPAPRDLLAACGPGHEPDQPRGAAVHWCLGHLHELVHQDLPDFAIWRCTWEQMPGGAWRSGAVQPGRRSVPEQLHRLDHEQCSDQLQPPEPRWQHSLLEHAVLWCACSREPVHV